MEGLLVVFIVFASGVSIVKMSIEYAKWKRQHEYSLPDSFRDDSDDTLGMGELKGLIQEAVQEAQAPLVDRLDRLENQALPALPPASQEADTNS